jgi:hypothetical protein
MRRAKRSGRELTHEGERAAGGYQMIKGDGSS